MKTGKCPVCGKWIPKTGECQHSRVRRNNGVALLPMPVVIRDYMAGETLAVLGHRYGVARNTVARGLQLAGVQLRGPGREFPVMVGAQRLEPAEPVELSAQEVWQLRRTIGWQPHWMDDYDYVNGD